MGRSDGKRGCGLCRICSILFTLAIIGAGGYCAWFFLGQPSGDEIIAYGQDIGETIMNIDFGDFTDVLKDFTGFSPDFFNEDPFVGDNTTNLWTGYTSGEGGLSLELWNALDENWQTEFTESVKDWNTYCNPKVLVLTTEKVPVDYECTHVDGVMKVCNGNYKETGWLGINEVMKTVPAGIIQSSVAKMNEHYLHNADYDDRLYTMCHELGHGYGLPHTDENFNNNDLGDCLDYTSTPSNNLRPGEANCRRLLEMYGPVDPQINRRTRRTTAAVRNEDGSNNKKKKRRTLRYRSDAELYEDYYSGDEEEELVDDDGSYYFDYMRSEYPTAASAASSRGTNSSSSSSSMINRGIQAEYESAMEELYYDISRGKYGAASSSRGQQQHPREEEEDEKEEPVEATEATTKKWRRLRSANSGDGSDQETENRPGADFVRRLGEDFVLEVHVVYPTLIPKRK